MIGAQVVEIVVQRRPHLPFSFRFFFTFLSAYPAACVSLDWQGGDERTNGMAFPRGSGNGHRADWDVGTSERLAKGERRPVCSLPTTPPPFSILPSAQVLGVVSVGAGLPRIARNSAALPASFAAT